MKMHHECFPCFLNQAIRAGNLLGISQDRQWSILKAVSRYLATVDTSSPPPKNAVGLYDIVAQSSGVEDPYKDIKKKGTQEALRLYPLLKKRVKDHVDPLFAALRLAIAGNVIDYGVALHYDLESEVEEILDAAFARWDYNAFQERLNQAQWILYIGDNAGETVFDRLLIEEIRRPVRYVVRGGPIINDVTVEDAKDAHIDEVAEIVSSGLRMPGIDLEKVSPEFFALFHEAPMVISKGQGNFETLTPTGREIFFLFKIKCKVVARYLGCPMGSLFMGTY